MSWETFWNSFTPALIATLKVFAIGSTGFYPVRRDIIGADGLKTLGQLVAVLTMPCLIFYRFATKFDPETFPDW